MATIYEVAQRAGVSPATVSRVLNGIAVSPAYAERVRRAAEELDFQPDRAARRLRRRTSEVIALIIPDVENPFFTALARGAEDRASEAGLSLVLCNTDEQEAKETRYLKVALSERMAGVILAPSSHHPDLDALVSRGTPVVAVDRGAHGYDLDSVVMDDVAIGRAGTERLYASGHRRVACITGPVDVDTADQRADGWCEVFAAHHPGADPQSMLVRADYRVDGGRRGMERLLGLPEPPDAVLVANNLMGVGAMRALDAHPGGDDVDLVVVGDLPFGLWPRPGSVVLPLPARELGTRAADRLIARIGGDQQDAHRIVVPVEPSHR
ncbi:LacI family transcriptional regulator [Mumia flava]|uniref:LacI family transcriptional regulator n=1 Tax=Mumia flava TaxID=1348852 RepID=A0A0B2BE69_9ACTN|nr:LacI family DNA-binding transcriptional regulator [Mumia flava]PJJ53716.1 LacI family transcriptional regulator [Mumia flava]